MSPRIVVRACLIALITLLAALPANGLGAPPQIFHARFLDTFEDTEVCGINVDIVSEGVFTDKLFFDKAGNPVRFMSTVSGVTRFTADDGTTLVNRFSNQYLEREPVVDEEAGTITFTFSYKGLPEMLKLAHGGVLLRDAGFIMFQDTVDLETGELISSEILINKGPHPDAESGFELFCEVFTEALG